jgi:hypothetical protein
MAAALTPTQRTLRAKIAAHESWAQTDDRTARTANARRAAEQRFLAQAGGDPLKAEQLRRLFYLRMTQKSVQARARRRGGDAA